MKTFPIIICLSISTPVGVNAQRLIVESSFDSVSSSQLDFSEPAISVAIGTEFMKNSAMLVGISGSLGQNTDSHLKSIKVDPVFSRDTLFSETIKSIKFISLLGRHRWSFSEKFSGFVSAGPSLFQIDTEHSIVFVSGATNPGGGIRVPSYTDRIHTGFGGTAQFGVNLLLTETLGIHLLGQYFSGRYKRKIDFVRLEDPVLEPIFGDLRRSERFNGFSIGWGIAFHY